MTDAAAPPQHVFDELRAIIASLEHARRTLHQGDRIDLDELWPRLETCARRIGALDHVEAEGMRPTMLALLDELQRTITAFGAEHRHLAERLRSTSRSAAAGAAYSRAEGR